jgi:succinoglycan biosynthesis transport protein ExoP
MPLRVSESHINIMANEYELTLLDYLSIMRRRAPYLAGIFAAVLLISIIVAVTIPPTYRSTGTIMVESPQISDNVVPSAIKNQIDEQISIIRQRVMTRDSLLRIANKYDLFKDNKRSMTSSELIDTMRDRISVELISSDETYNSQRGKPTIAFMLSFEDKYPETAYRVATDLTALFMDWNVRLRTAGATETTEFLSQEADKLKLEVDRLDELISAYKQQHGNTLPEQMNLRTTILSRAESDMREVERDIRSTEEELSSLEGELAVANSGMGESTDSSSQTLSALKAEYARLSGIYNESYPDMRVLKRKIENLEKKGDNTASVTASSPAAYRIQTKIAAAKGRLQALTTQKRMLVEKITQNERAMMQTPQVEQGLDALVRDRDNAQKKYEELHGKKVSAQIAQSLESENKSERFTLLEPPLLPDRYFKPNRIKIIALGFLLAIASSFAGLLVMASFDRQIRGTEALAHVTGQRPLAVIPYLFIQEESVRRKHLLKLAIIISVGVVIAIAVAVHFLYMPLDVLLLKAFARLS